MEVSRLLVQCADSELDGRYFALNWGCNLQGSDCFLVIEVSDTSLLTDRTEKLRLYAEARVPEY